MVHSNIDVLTVAGCMSLKFSVLSQQEDEQGITAGKILQKINITNTIFIHGAKMLRLPTFSPSILYYTTSIMSTMK